MWTHRYMATTIYVSTASNAKSVQLEKYSYSCRSESPSQVFIITIQWLLHTLISEVPQSEWPNVIIAYDNMCHLNSLKAAQNDLPPEEPFNKIWKQVTKIIDSLHFSNHVDPKCRELYDPKRVKEAHPHYNLMCAEQTFVWLSRFKRILCSMSKTHHCFFLHRTVKRCNAYRELCLKLKRKVLLPKITKS